MWSVLIVTVHTVTWITAKMKLLILPESACKEGKKPLGVLSFSLSLLTQALQKCFRALKSSSVLIKPFIQWSSQEFFWWGRFSCITLCLQRAAQGNVAETLRWPGQSQHAAGCHLVGLNHVCCIFKPFNSGGVFPCCSLPSLRLEQAQITKQGAWQGHIFHFGLTAVHIQQIWHNYSGKSETRSPGTSQMRETFKDEFLTKQSSSASSLAADFNSFLQNCCRAAGAGDCTATKPEGRKPAWVPEQKAQICFWPTWALQLPCLSSSLPPPRHWRQCLSPWGYKRKITNQFNPPSLPAYN